MLRIEPQKTGVGVGVGRLRRARPIIDRIIHYTAAVSKIWAFRIWGGLPSRKLAGSKNLGGVVVKKLGCGHD